MQEHSRIPGFYKYPVSERLRILYERQVLSEDDYHLLMDQRHILDADDADRLVENVIGVFTLPMGLGLNFLVNGKDYLVPLVVEEPSILAAVSAAAKTVREGGGFLADSDEPVLIGQIQVVDVAQPLMARNQILQSKAEILGLANSLHPRMAARNGGAKDLEVAIHSAGPQSRDMLVVHVMVDTRDAMGANMVNSMCEGLAPLIEKLTGGKVFLRILSNLTDRSMVRARCSIPVSALSTRTYSGEEVRDGIILAAEFAAVDPYRAATHNKGIMNGIDAVAIATGNDWRAIEAAAHAYAGRGMSYTSLTRWSVGAKGELEGEITIPLKVGIVGGPVQSNPAVQVAHRLMGIKSARELAEVMGAVGLAQNLGALRALSTEGIQRGHMSLHARSVAVAAGASEDVFEEVVERLINAGEIKIWKAKEIIEELGAQREQHVHAEGNEHDDGDEQLEHRPQKLQSGYGKIVLFGEHAVVYGARAIAAPIPMAIQARCERRTEGGIRMVIPRWRVEENLPTEGEGRNYLQRSVDLIMRRLGLRNENATVEIYPHVPRAMGLGSSAALAVAGIRAVAACYDIELTDAQINALAFECEQLAHGTPSGIDNTLATYGQMVLFKKGEPAQMDPITLPKAVPMVIGISGVESLTSKTVANVREAWTRNPAIYDKIFKEIDGITMTALEALQRYDLGTVGELMNICQGLLNALQVSSPELEELVAVARGAGALGAKLTGGGGGGSMIALTPDDGGETAHKVAAAIRSKGYRAVIANIGVPS